MPGTLVEVSEDHFQQPGACPESLLQLHFTALSSFPLTEVDVGKDQEFTIKSKGAGGQGKVASKIVGPSGTAVPCKVEAGLAADNSVVRFVPREEGPYEVEVTYDGVPVPGSPFPLEAVAPTKPSKVTAVWWALSV